MDKRLARHQGGMAAALAAMLLAACGGGGGSGDDGGGAPPPAPVTLTGKLLDSAVGGVKFTSTPSGKTGMTGTGGEFLYVAGDTVQFAVGNIVLGSVSGQPTVTPKVIADATVSLPAGVASSDVAQNLAVFLQSFDADGNPDNGITIAADVGVAAASLTLNFGQKPEDFSKDPSLTKLASDTGSTVVTPEDADAHQTRSLGDQLAGTWVEKSGENMVTFTVFTDGTYVLAMKDPSCNNGVEWGRFVIDPNAGTISSEAAAYVDTTTADCGLHHTDQGATQYVGPFEINGDTLTLNREDGDHTLTRVPTGTGIAGSWLLDQEIDPVDPEHGIEAPLIVTFFQDGKYLLTHVGDGGNGQPLDDGGFDGNERGIEFGAWSVDSNGKLSVSPTFDNTPAGLDCDDADDCDDHVTLSVDAATGKLVLKVISDTDADESHAYTLSRLPLTKTIEVSDLFGTWYFADPEHPDADPEAGYLGTVTFFKDGTYAEGESEPDDSSGGSDPHSIGSEFGSWHLELGLGRLYADNAVVDSNGGSGLHHDSEFPGPAYGNVVFVRKIDADTLEITFYEFQNGAPDEANDHTYLAGKGLLKRVKSVANSLMGSWSALSATGQLNEVFNFFPNGSVFVVDTSEGGGVERGRWAVGAGGDSATLTVSSSDPFCVDTINSESDCNGEGLTYTDTLSFSADGMQATLTNVDGTGYSFDLRKISSP